MAHRHSSAPTSDETFSPIANCRESAPPGVEPGPGPDTGQIYDVPHVGSRLRHSFTIVRSRGATMMQWPW
jgi:hypothetical protein